LAPACKLLQAGTMCSAGMVLLHLDYLMITIKRVACCKYVTAKYGWLLVSSAPDCNRGRGSIGLCAHLSKSSTALLYSRCARKHRPLFRRKSTLAAPSSCTALSKSARAASGRPIFSSSSPLALCDRAFLGSIVRACSKSAKASCSLQSESSVIVCNQTIVSVWQPRRCMHKRPCQKTQPFNSARPGMT